MSSTVIVSFFVAATAVTLVQFLRVREPKLVPLLVLFGLLGLAHTHEYWESSFKWLHLLAGTAGLVLMYLVSPRHQPRSR